MTGVVGASHDGLCLGNKGVFTQPTAGYVVGIAAAAAGLEGHSLAPEEEEGDAACPSFSVVVETDNGQFLVSSHAPSGAVLGVAARKPVSS